MSRKKQKGYHTQKGGLKYNAKTMVILARLLLLINLEINYI